MDRSFFSTLKPYYFNEKNSEKKAPRVLIFLKFVVVPLWGLSGTLLFLINKSLRPPKQILLIKTTGTTGLMVFKDTLRNYCQINWFVPNRF